MPPDSNRVLVPDISHLRFPKESERNHPIRFLFGKTMGTTWRCNVAVPSTTPLKDVEELINDGLKIVIDQMSHWDSNSCLSKFNRSPDGTWHDLPAEFFFVLESSLSLADKSGGIYDPTIGEVINQLGFGPEKPSVFSYKPADLALIRDKCGWEKILLEPNRNRALQPGGVHLDLSSIAKGFAVDLVAGRLQSKGISNFLFEIGGEFRGEGCKPDGSPWWVEVERSNESNQSLMDGRKSRNNSVRIAACGLSIATSGHKHHNQRLPTGETICHLVNATNCRASPNELTSVTVIDRSCMLADGWATALFVAGLESGLQLATRFQLAAIFLTHENQHVESPMIAKLFD